VPTDEHTTTRAIETFLGKANGPVSEADIAAGSGVGLPFVRTELYTLMRRYECTLNVRDDGAIDYNFGGRLRHIGKPTLGERAKAFGAKLWRGFKRVYRFSLAAVLVTYTVAFSVLILAVMLRAMGDSDDADMGGVFRTIGRLFAAIFEATTHTAVMLHAVDNRGYGHRRYQPSRPWLKAKQARDDKKSFIASVYDFVLGPERVQINAGAQTREIAAFVRTRKGVLTVADIQALSGMSREEAQRFFARFVAEFEGETVITEHGLLVALFPALLEKASSEYDEPIQLFWDEYEPPHELNGNEGSTNMLVAALAGVNLFMSFAVLSEFGGTMLATWLGGIPALIFSLFFLIPLARWFFVRRANEEQHETNQRKRVFRQLFEAREDSVPLASVLQRANAARTTEEVLELEAMDAVLQQAARDVGELQGDRQSGLSADAHLVHEEQHAYEQLEVATRKMR
jgi:hypothetical protein